MNRILSLWEEDTGMLPACANRTRKWEGSVQCVHTHAHRTSWEDQPLLRPDRPRVASYPPPAYREEDAIFGGAGSNAEWCMTGWKGWLRGSKPLEAEFKESIRDDPGPPMKSGNPAFKKTTPTRSAREVAVG